MGSGAPQSRCFCCVFEHEANNPGSRTAAEEAREEDSYRVRLMMYLDWVPPVSFLRPGMHKFNETFHRVSDLNPSFAQPEHKAQLAPPALIGRNWCFQQMDSCFPKSRNRGQGAPGL